MSLAADLSSSKTWRADCCVTIEDLDSASDESWAIANRLAIGLLLGMMVMLTSLMLYAEFIRVDIQGMSSKIEADDIFFFKLLMFLAATPTVILLGWPIARNSWNGLKERRLSTDSLILLGSVSAYLVSIYGMATGGEVYFDTATLILLLVTIGHFLEIRAQIKSSEALEKLLEQAPDEATVIRGGEEKRVAAELVMQGERVIVHPGETFPVDGKVLRGEGSVNEANVTGEARPVFKEEGRVVYSGAVSLDGYFVLEATGVGEDRIIARLIRLLTEARQHRAPIQRLADKVATVFVPAAMLISLFTFLFWSWQLGPEEGMLRGLSVLLIACPCALGLATPLAIWAGLNRAAAEGILVRHAEALEKLSRVRHFFFDKTGTLTRGTLNLGQIIVAPGGNLTETDLLKYAAGLESASEHPLGRAIVNEARQRNLTFPAPETVKIQPGLGIEGTLNVHALPLTPSQREGEPKASSPWGREAVSSSGIDAKRFPHQGGQGRLDAERFLHQGDELPSTIAVGSARYLKRLDWSIPDYLRDEKADLEGAGQTVIYCGLDGEAKGLFAFKESIRPEAPQTLAALQQAGLSVAVLTGDTETAGRALSESLNVPVYSGLLPQDKVAHLKQSRQKEKNATANENPAGGRQPALSEVEGAACPEPAEWVGSRIFGGVAMVGDGLNDAPALAAADIGIALGSGVDVTRETADISLLGEDLENVVWVWQLAHATYRRIRWNLVWAFFYNVIGVALAVAGVLHPIISALAMVLSNLMVVGNSMGLYRFGKKDMTTQPQR